jgi:hypothetical protein
MRPHNQDSQTRSQATVTGSSCTVASKRTPLCPCSAASHPCTTHAASAVDPCLPKIKPPSSRSVRMYPLSVTPAKRYSHLRTTPLSVPISRRCPPEPPSGPCCNLTSSFAAPQTRCPAASGLDRGAQTSTTKHKPPHQWPSPHPLVPSTSPHLVFPVRDASAVVSLPYYPTWTWALSSLRQPARNIIAPLTRLLLSLAPPKPSSSSSSSL